MRQRSELGAPGLLAVLASLAVVFGVLSMHAIDGGAHTPGSADHAIAAGPSVHGSMHVQLGDVVGAIGGVSASTAAVAPLGTPEGAAASAAVCMAVLLTVVLVVRRRLGHARSLPRLGNRWRRGIACVRGSFPARPPDLLAELCVMRT